MTPHAPTASARLDMLPVRSGREHLTSPAPRSEPATARRTYSVGEAAAILGISRTTAYQCVRTKELPSLRFRGRIVIPAAVIDALLEDPASLRR
jgi:excisionase family DNA binding protein